MSIADRVIFFAFILFIPFKTEMFARLFLSYTLFHHMPYPSFIFIHNDKKDSTPYRAKSLALPPDFTYYKIRISFSDTDISYPFLWRAPVGYYSLKGFAPPLEGPFNKYCFMEVTPFFHSL